MQIVYSQLPKLGIYRALEIHIETEKGWWNFGQHMRTYPSGKNTSWYGLVFTPRENGWKNAKYIIGWSTGR